MADQVIYIRLYDRMMNHPYATGAVTETALKLFLGEAYSPALNIKVRNYLAGAYERAQEQNRHTEAWAVDVNWLLHHWGHIFFDAEDGTIKLTPCPVAVCKGCISASRPSGDPG